MTAAAIALTLMAVTLLPFAAWLAVDLLTRLLEALDNPRPVSDDPQTEYAAAHARTDDEWDAILAAVDWDALDAEVGTP